MQNKTFSLNENWTLQSAVSLYNREFKMLLQRRVGKSCQKAMFLFPYEFH